MAREDGRVRGLLVDYGGVLTTSVFGSFTAFCDSEGLPPDRVVELFRHEARPLLVGLEEGTLPERSFETAFAALLGVSPDGLIGRLMAGAALDRRMAAAVRLARQRGVRTGLVSNSWGLDWYDHDLLTGSAAGVLPGLSARAGDGRRHDRRRGGGLPRGRLRAGRHGVARRRLA